METKYGYVAVKKEGSENKIDFANCKFLSTWDLLKFLNDNDTINEVLNGNSQIKN